jgi:hypothetical protein
MRGPIVKHIVISILAFSVCLLALGATAAENDATQSPLLEPQLSGHPPLPKLPNGQPVRMPSVPPAGQMVSGVVLETLDAGGYTYARVKVGEEELWAAGVKVALKVGDTVSFSKGMEMKGFRSKSLDRTFESVYFVTELDVGTAPPTDARAVASPHGLVGSAPAANSDISGIKPADGGKTVKEIYEETTSLSGKEVSIRAKVVKANLGVMGKNWFHLRDGTQADDGNNDLTITSMDTAAVGDIVLVRGKVVTDRDFGFGYHYDLIIEEGKLLERTEP